MSWVITPSNLLVDDQDAVTYLTAVEAADGQALESATRLAVNAFVKGCKADGTWNAIKASCILAGARTLAGALVPLVGAVPTNFNFVSGDYNRKTGLVGNGSTKYLDSNRNNNADPQDSQHLSVYASSLGSFGKGFISSDSGSSSGTSSILYASNGGGAIFTRSRSSAGSVGGLASTGFWGISRNSSAAYTSRVSSVSQSISVSSGTAANASIRVFTRSSDAFTDARLAFYSIGESLDLALLDARVTTLINALAAAIP